MRKNGNSTKGFVTAIAVVISLAILVFFGGIYHVIQNSIRENIVIDLRDQSRSVAEAAVGQVINKIRANPNLQQLDKEIKDKTGALIMPDTLRDGNPDSLGFYDVYHRLHPNTLLDKDNKPLGQYFSKVKVVGAALPDWATPDPPIFKNDKGQKVTSSIFHIMTEGWALDKKERQRSRTTVHSFVYLSNVGEYFCAVKGHLKVSPGANLGNGKIFGHSLEFDMSGGPNSISMARADYIVDYLPYKWPEPTMTGFQSVKIAEGPDDTNDPDDDYHLPKRLEAPLVFPTINEHIDFYGNPAVIAAGERLDTFPDYPIGGGAVSDCYIPNGVILMPPSVHAVGYTPTNDNHDHVYYCDDPDGVVIGDNVTIQGQVIIVSKGPVRLRGDIFIANGDIGQTIRSTNGPNPSANGYFNGYVPPDGTPPAPVGVPSTADQLVIYAKEGIIIDKDWCSVGGGPHLTLQGLLLVAPDAGLTYEIPSSGVFCSNYATYSLDFLGAMYLSDQPFLGGIFKLDRKYRYLETLATDPPPVRQSFQILKQFVMRRAMPTASPY